MSTELEERKHERIRRKEVLNGEWKKKEVRYRKMNEMGKRE